LDEYHDHLPPLETRYALYLSLFSWFRASSEADELIDTSVGLCAVVGRAWRHLIDEEDEKGLTLVSQFLGLWFRHKTWNSAAFENLVNGVGGTLEDLASLIVLHIRRVLPNSDSTVTPQTISHLTGVLYLVDSGILRQHWNYSFRTALSSHGIVTALTTVSLALALSTEDMAQLELKPFLATLVDHLCTFPRQRWVTESLRAGLLSAILTCGTARHIEGINISLVDLLQDILPTATIFRSVLLQLRVSLMEVRDRDPAETLGNARRGPTGALGVVPGIGEHPTSGCGRI
jgi:hypothetical protein